MQQENYYNVEEGPPGDDDYTWASGEDGTSSNSRRHAQRPTGHHASLLIPCGLRHLLTGT